MSTTNETPTVALVRCRISPRNCALFCFLWDGGGRSAVDGALVMRRDIRNARRAGCRVRWADQATRDEFAAELRQVRARHRRSA